MMGEGALENVEAIFAAHVSHQHTTGMIGSRPGPLLAGCGFFKAIIRARNGKIQHQGANPVLAASAAVISLQGIVSRESNPLDSQVVSVTTFSSGDDLDVMSDAVVLKGTLRAFSNSSFYLLIQRIEEASCYRSPEHLMYIMWYESKHVISKYELKWIGQMNIFSAFYYILLKTNT